MKIVRLTKTNTEALNLLVKNSGNELLTVGRAANMCVEKGMPAVRRRFVKSKPQKATA
jgi:hypothetical protein